MMNFRTINKAIIQTLGNAALGRFRVVGYEAQGKAAQEVKGNLREVQSYFTQGDFPKSAGRTTGSAKHLMIFTLGFTVSAAAKVNLAVINREGVTAGQIAGALSALKDAAYEADILFDELTDIVYQIMRDGCNYELGLPVGTVTEVWVDQIRKDAPAPNGELLVLTGAMQFSCSTNERVTGDYGARAVGGVTVGIDTPGDVTQKTEIQVIP